MKIKIKGILRWIFCHLLRLLCRKRYILFESYPTYSDSMRLVFDEFVRRGLVKKFGLVWVTTDKQTRCDEEMQKYPLIDISTDKGRKRFFHFYYYLSSICICSNHIIHVHPWRNKASNFYITHGSVVKNARNAFSVPDTIDCVLSASEAMNPYLAWNFDFPISRIYALGLPRNDDLVNTEVDIRKLLHTSAGKVIVWYPTFRQKKEVVWTHSSSLPLIHDFENAKLLNEYAAAHDVLFVVKPHFVQDTARLEKHPLSNIRFINDDFFFENKIRSYQFVGKCDALLSDYSSVAHDFTLCDKPIGLVWEDIDAYRQNPGFTPGIEHFLDGAHKIYDMKQLFGFIDIVITGEDPLAHIREKIKCQVNFAADAGNTRRVVDFILSKSRC